MDVTDFFEYATKLRAFTVLESRTCIFKAIPMKVIQFLNILLSLGFISVLYGTISMLAFNGYDDNLSLTCFVLHSINGFLLVARAVYKA